MSDNLDIVFSVSLGVCLESHNQEEEDSEDEKEETTKNLKKNQQQKDGGQSGILSYLSTFLPKRKPNAYLPDDKSPKVSNIATVHL